ncbi:ABC transporter ATP-binding protein [Rossellomorea vietnamensis]|uniref:ABC transporter ATP-binding protein n=1 Tax=Rossellomorea vietnamensis TaxID=218284 RepID=UPI00077CD677|nr:dipeptide ABC transporter ATP-binding protein [Rossellomorea vietnamensis]
MKSELIDNENSYHSKEVSSEILLETKNLTKWFPIKSGILKRTTGYVKAVDDISFSVRKGETFSLVGESGSGKSTLGRAVLRLHEPTSGEVHFEGKDITHLPSHEMRKLRREMQIIYQDPFGSLDPRMNIGDIVGEPLDVHRIARGKQRNERIDELLELVGLDPSRKSRYPHEFSGGQRQRVGIARAIALNPKFILADEAVSALDVSVQAQVVNLLKELQQKLGLTYLFIAHGLNIVRHISDRVGVMYLGQMVEIGEVDEVYKRPAHPYTSALISTKPSPNPRARKKKVILEGEIPSPSNPPTGCRFHTRCPLATEICKQDTPILRPVSDKQSVACHFPLV